MNRIQARRDLEARITTSLEKLTITAYSFEKMNAYARIVSGLAGQSIECGGLLIGEYRNGIPVVTNAILLDGQVTHADGHFDYDRMNEEYLRTRDEGKVIMGMWHSHGNFGVFHSTYDDAHLEVLLDRNTRLLPNLLLREEKASKVRWDMIRGEGTDNKVSIAIKEPAETTIEIRFNDCDHTIVQDALASIAGIYVQETRGIPFAVSVVINKKSYGDKKYIESPILGETVYIEAIAKHSSSRTRIVKCKGMGIEILPEDSILDEQSLYKEVSEKVTYNGRKIGSTSKTPPMKTEETPEHTLAQNVTVQGGSESQSKMSCKNSESEKIIELDMIAKRYDHIVHCNTYVDAINRKIMHRYKLLQERRQLKKSDQGCSANVYSIFIKQRGGDDGQDQKEA